jgi:hypothetical protein
MLMNSYVRQATIPTPLLIRIMMEMMGSMAIMGLTKTGATSKEAIEEGEMVFCVCMTLCSW